MKAGIVLDSWKLKIFERVLKAAGFTWTQHPGVTKDTISLMVETDRASDLYKAVKQANTEAAKTVARN